MLTDNGKEFTDRLFASKEREPSGEHGFDQLCQALGIEHRLTKPRTPKTNGMVERFNGHINVCAMSSALLNRWVFKTSAMRPLKRSTIRLVCG